VLDLSEQNVALVTSVYRAVNENDLDTFLSLMHPEVELMTSGIYPDFSASYRGHPGALKYWEAARGLWENFTVEIKRVEAVGDQVLVLLQQRVEGRDGITVEHAWGHLFAFADDLIRRVTGFASWEAAVEAVGVESGTRGG
jgi:ketosteroid isomerase-like protein